MERTEREGRSRERRFPYRGNPWLNSQNVAT
jgi:hypothetical protein